jgi:hypothetical protein
MKTQRDIPQNIKPGFLLMLAHNNVIAEDIK